MGKREDDNRPGDHHNNEHWRWNKANDGGTRTDYDTYDWSGQQVDDYKQVRKEGSDR